MRIKTIRETFNYVQFIELHFFIRKYIQKLLRSHVRPVLIPKRAAVTILTQQQSSQPVNSRWRPLTTAV